MAPSILIFSIAMGADCSSYVKTIETNARAFFALNIFAIRSVTYAANIINLFAAFHFCNFVFSYFGHFNFVIFFTMCSVSDFCLAHLALQMCFQ